MIRLIGWPNISLIVPGCSSARDADDSPVQHKTRQIIENSWFYRPCLCANALIVVAYLFHFSLCEKNVPALFFFLDLGTFLEHKRFVRSQ